MPRSPAPLGPRFWWISARRVCHGSIFCCWEAKSGDANCYCLDRRPRYFGCREKQTEEASEAIPGMALEQPGSIPQVFAAGQAARPRKNLRMAGCLWKRAFPHGKSLRYLRWDDKLSFGSQTSDSKAVDLGLGLCSFLGRWWALSSQTRHASFSFACNFGGRFAVGMGRRGSNLCWESERHYKLSVQILSCLKMQHQGWPMLCSASGSQKLEDGHAKHQAARIDPADIVQLLQIAFSKKSRDQKLWPFPASTLRKRLADLLKAIKLPTDGSESQHLDLSLTQTRRCLMASVLLRRQWNGSP